MSKKKEVLKDLIWIKPESLTDYEIKYKAEDFRTDFGEWYVKVEEKLETLRTIGNVVQELEEKMEALERLLNLGYDEQPRYIKKEEDKPCG